MPDAIKTNYQNQAVSLSAQMLTSQECSKAEVVREAPAGDRFEKSSITADDVDVKRLQAKAAAGKKDPILEALDIRNKLETLQGEERQAYIREFKEKNRGKIFVSLNIHNHQPIYRPGVHPADTPEIQKFVLGTGDADNRREVYTAADAYAIEEMRNNPNYPHFGFQVSYSGSLMENLERTAERGLWPGKTWNNRYKDLRATSKTPLGNPRLDLVNIGYHHPLMGLIAAGTATGKENVDPDKDIQLQIKMHQQAVEKLFGGPISKGFFPPEMAFSERMIPAIKKCGIEWTMVDNIHFDRTNKDYNNPGDGLKPPNEADKRTPGEHSYENLPNDLAKTHIVSPNALRPHYAKYTNPVTGEEELMLVVPEERSLSSYIQKDRDGSKLQEIINKFQKYNTDPEHPIFVLYATDGDNNGSNSGEFHRNLPIDLATRFPEQVVFTTIQDYLDIYPPQKPEEIIGENGVKQYKGGDVIHVEDGSWWGANLGDPQFSKWIDDPAYMGYSPKNNSWAALTAAKNEVMTADSLEPVGNTKESIDNIINNKGSDTEKAWHGLLVGQTSCYEYWEPNNVLSYSSIKGANMAIDNARQVITRHKKEEDKVGPSVFLPMHYPYNPADYGSNFNVVTYVYDFNGVKSVKVKYRSDDDGVLNKPQDFMYEGVGVKKWDGEVFLNKMPFPDLENKPDVWVEPKARADVYRGSVEVNIPENKPGEIIQYYVEAEDNLGNVTRSPIQNVYVRNGLSGSENLSPDEIHNRLKSGIPEVIAYTTAYVFAKGVNDVNVFNHVFYRLEQADDALMKSLNGLAEKGKMKLSDEAKFKNEFISRLEKHVLNPANVMKIKSASAFRDFLIASLKDLLDDPRVQKILAALG